jgi:hypothetical protein
MFRILCDPSSGSTELCLTEITMVCVYDRFKITLPNTDQAHNKIFVNNYE